VLCNCQMKTRGGSRYLWRQKHKKENIGRKKKSTLSIETSKATPFSEAHHRTYWREAGKQTREAGCRGRNEHCQATRRTNYRAVSTSPSSRVGKNDKGNRGLHHFQPCIIKANSAVSSTVTNSTKSITVSAGYRRKSSPEKRSRVRMCQRVETSRGQAGAR
jgi:hypothetical protein